MSGGIQEIEDSVNAGIQELGVSLNLGLLLEEALELLLNVVQNELRATRTITPKLGQRGGGDRNKRDASLPLCVIQLITKSRGVDNAHLDLAVIELNLCAKKKSPRKSQKKKSKNVKKCQKISSFFLRRSRRRKKKGLPEV